MKRQHLLTLFIIGIGNLFLTAQSVQIKDTESNLLLEIKDEGSVGSILLPDSAAAPGLTTNKLYNVNGSLFFNGKKLGLLDSTDGWTQESAVVRLSTITDNVGIGTDTAFSSLSVNGKGDANAAIYGESFGLVGRGVYGLANSSANTTNYGGWFKARGNTGRGVYGFASSAIGENYGGYFESASSSGRAVYGISTKTTGTNYGGYFQANGTTGRAVFGLAAGTTQVNYGGWFKAKGIGGQAVYGEASDVNGINYGGYFLAKSIQGRAVFGLAEYVDGAENFGGWFKGKGTSKGTGVYAWGKVYDFYADGPGDDFFSASSRRWKRNIVKISEPLEKVKALRGVYYDWNEEYGGHHDVGMIAEEVGEVMPEIVGYEENEIDAIGMDYSKLTPLLVEAVKELNRKVEELVTENEKLRAEISEIKGRLSPLQETRSGE